MADIFESILERNDVRRGFAPAVLAEAARIVAAPGFDDPDLVPLTHLPFVTIDYETSRDLDQALQIEAVRDGSARYLVRYALADGAHFVRPDSALFTEALARGASYYLPGRCIPMLPVELSEGIVSLNPGVVRRALVFEMTLDADAAPVHTRIVRGRIRSRAKLSYAGVQRLHDDPDGFDGLDREVVSSLRLLAEVGELRIAAERRRDVVEYNRTETEVRLQPPPDGGPPQPVLATSVRNDVSRWNEQISLLCNMEGARMLAARDEPCAQAVYRVHEAPGEGALQHLERVIAAVARSHGLDGDTWRWRRGRESLADFLERLPAEGEAGRVRAAIQRQVLITNTRSMFSADPGGHFALGVDPYCRFSAPMREIVGIFTHKEAAEALGLAAPTRGAAADEELRALVIEAANRARQRQRRIDKQVLKLAVDALLRGELERDEPRRRVFRGTVLGVRASRLYVRLDEPRVELKVYLEELERAAGGPLQLSEDGVELRRSGGAGAAVHRVGNSVAVRVAGHDDRRGRWRLLPVPLHAGTGVGEHRRC